MAAREPLRPARIVFDDAGPPRAPDFDDVYHPRAGALGQARHVFLAGCGLPGRWQGRGRFVVLETGFGLGHNFLATWDAWRRDPRRCERLWFVSVEKHPLQLADLQRAHRESPLPDLASALCAAWPPLTPDLHEIAVDDGRVMLQLVLGDARRTLRELRLQADAIYLDGFAPARNPELWDAELLKAVGRLAAPGARAATWSVAREVRNGLRMSGFEVETAPGFGGKREMTLARHAPRHQPARLPGRDAASAGREAIVVGAGLAGAACAAALARDGLRCEVLDRHARPAQEASGNEAGLFHGSLHPDDGPHARFNRAAALQAERSYRPWLDPAATQRPVRGELRGLLRREPDGEAAAMQALIDALGLPPDYVAALDAVQAGRAAGLPAATPAWFYPGGGWLSPGDAVATWLATPGVSWQPGAAVHSLRHDGDAWQACDAAGRVLARAPVAVLANGHDALRLLGADWPLGRQRGQVSFVEPGTPGLCPPARPLAGGGYALTLPDGRVLCGATASRDDEEPALREADHRFNLDRLAQITGSRPDADPARMTGRVGWRCLADDRLPVVGAVPQAQASALRVAEVGRRPGLYVCTALASRGITWAPLLGALLAAWVSGAPMPLPGALVDALDPARFAVRRARRPQPLRS